MTEKRPEPDDPMALVAVEVPAGPAALEDMAYVFAEEFARLGFDESRILRLFRTPFYAGPYRVRQALGEDAVRAIVAECVQVWSRSRGA